jgi:hypothetical protein
MAMDDVLLTPALLSVARTRSGWAQLTDAERQAVADHYGFKVSTSPRWHFYWWGS